VECTCDIALWRDCLSVISLITASLTLSVWRGMIGLQLIWTGCGRKRPILIEILPRHVPGERHEKYQSG